MWLNIIAAFVIALLSGLGVGGGGLFTVYLALVADMPQLAAQGLNLLFFLFSSGASVTVQLFRRRIRYSAVGIMIVSGIAGVLLGTLLSGFIGGEWLRRLFGIMLMSGGILSLRASVNEEYSKNRSTVSNTDPTCPTTENEKTIK
jgi:uncharacterized membrane protein YfcA